MSDKPDRKDLTFIMSRPPWDYMGITCRRCGQTWIFLKETIIDDDGILDWTCPYCRDRTEINI